MKSGKKVNPPAKHHYIPVFYLKQWANAQGQLVEYQRIQERIFLKAVYPTATGFKRNLYTIPSLPKHLAQALETGFLQLTDDKAAVLLKRFIGSDAETDGEQRTSWSRFLIALIHRNPEKIDWLRQQWDVGYAEAMQNVEMDYAKLRRDGDPETYAQMKEKSDPSSKDQHFLMLLHSVMDSELLGTHLNQMQWSILKMADSAHDLVASDRPVVVSNGLVQPGAHICLALGPSHLFVACNTSDDIARLINLGASLSGRYNDIVVKQAAKFVYARSRAMGRFVDERLGRFPTQFIGSKG